MRLLAAALAVTIFSLQAVLSLADSVVGCGGFVQASPALSKFRKSTDPKYDYSTIKIELQNSEGLIKDHTQCAPNGYFFLPVYDKGSFFLHVKGPEGWNFTPDRVAVSVDESACNGNEDVLFQYTGFSVSGSVKGPVVTGSDSSCSEGGPPGVAVSLTRTDVGEAESQQWTALTDSQGRYVVTDVPVGKYRISASHPTWPVEPVPGTAHELEVGWGSMAVPDAFQVAGYDLSGRVLAQGEPVLGVEVFLFSSSTRSLPSCADGIKGLNLTSLHQQLRQMQQRQEGKGQQKVKKPLCRALSDATGTFRFPRLPCGTFWLVPQYAGGTSALFDISPANMSVTVGHGSAVTPEAFQVTGFSIAGTVLNHVGAGVPNVTVLVNGRSAAVTDAKGAYTLDRLSSGTYSVSAQKTHYTFSALKEISVVPSMGVLPVISVETYSVCGKVEVESGSQFSGRRQVTLTHEQESERPQAKSSDANGAFCFQVPPGSYHLSPHVSPSEAAAGLIFTPSSALVKVVAQPRTAVTFKQAFLSISGRVVCRELCDKHVRVTLTSASASSASEEPRSLYLDGQSDSFMFDRVTPGEYVVKVQKQLPPAFRLHPNETEALQEFAAEAGSGSLPPTSEEEYDEWCWKEETHSQRVTVGAGAEEYAEDEVGNDVAGGVVPGSVRGLRFEQSGWRLRVVMSHPQKADVAHDVAKPWDVELQKGYQEMCLNESGVHTLLFMDGCKFFGAFAFPYSVDNPEMVRLEATLHLLTGRITVDSRLFPDANNMSDYTFPRFFNATDGRPIDQRSFSYIKHHANGSQPLAIYEWYYWGQPGESLFISPYHNGKLLEEVKTEEELTAEAEREQEKQQRESLEQSGLNEEDVERSMKALKDTGDLPADIKERLGIPEAAAAGGGGGGGGEEKVKMQDMLEEMNAMNPAVLGRPTDVDEMAKKQKEKMGGGSDDIFGSFTETDGEGKQEEVAPEDEAGGLQEGDEAYQDLMEEIDLSGTEGEAAPEEEEEDEYAGLPMNARPYLEDPEPWPPRVKVLFYPRRQYAIIDGEKCNEPVPAFVGRPGVYLSGSVTPPLPGVNVSVVVDSESATAGWVAGQTVAWGLTQEEGLFMVGPLYDDATYHTEASKFGYVFRSLPNNSFEAQRLASLKVTVTLSPSGAASPSEEPLPPVFLSLTGDNGYRRNQQTTSATVPSEGIKETGFEFEGLFPGSFHLRPLLKEYSFLPASHSLEISSGEARSVEFVANRVAFSIFGRVTSLTGMPEPGVTVEARSTPSSSSSSSSSGVLYETAVTNEAGEYRLRGMVPNTGYDVRVVRKESSKVSPLPLERASPSSVHVIMAAEDAPDINFVAFDQPQFGSITGTVVNGPDFATWQPNLLVEAARAASPSHVEKSEPLPVSGFFELTGLPRAKYVVRLRLSFPKKTHSFESNISEADLEERAVVHVGAMSFKVEERVVHQDLTPSSALPLLFSFLVVVLVANASRVKDAFQRVASAGSGKGFFSGSRSSNVGAAATAPGLKQTDQAVGEKKRAARRTY